MENIVEVVIFDVKTGKEKEFEEASKNFAEFIKTQEGYVRRWYFRNKIHPNRFVHCTEYRDRKTGENIIEQYKKKVGVEKFNNYFELLRRMPVIEWHEVWFPENL